MSKIISVFPETDLRKGHLGLRELYKKDISKMGSNFVIFINRKQTAFKLLNGNLVVHYRAPFGRIDINTIQFLPYCFDATGAFNYNKALEAVFKHKLAKKKNATSRHNNQKQADSQSLHS
jgi:hypothetical protein